MADSNSSWISLTFKRSSAVRCAFHSRTLSTISCFSITVFLGEETSLFGGFLFLRLIARDIEFRPLLPILSVQPENTAQCFPFVFDAVKENRFLLGHWVSHARPPFWFIAMSTIEAICPLR